MENNPYNYTRPVTNPNMFFGRWDLVDKLVDGLTESNPCSFAIYGGRRSGKTSVMGMLERKLNERLDAGGQPIVIPLFMNMQFDPPTSTADFFERLLHRLVEWQSSLSSETVSLPAIRETDPAPSFAEAFRELYRFVQPELGGVKLAILIDESEKLHRPEWSRGLEDNLRALLSNVPGVSGHMGLVMSGGVDFYHDMVAKRDGSPLRNVLDEEIILQPCSYGEMMRLVKEPTDDVISDKVAGEIGKQAGGHLFLGQFIMKNLWVEGLDDANVELVQEISSSFPERRRDYERWLDSIGADAKKVYTCLSDEKGDCGRGNIGEALGMKRLDVKKALDILAFHSLIQIQDQKYACGAEMFRAWFMENVLHQPRVDKPIEIFISYAHEDEQLCNALKTHLSTLERQKVIKTWHDRRIQPGQEWAGEIDKHINTAKIILFMISADFMASDYCNEVEVKCAMERHEADNARVIPVILRPADWNETPFSKLHALPKNAEPITEWSNRDRAFLDVVNGIRATIKELKE